MSRASRLLPLVALALAGCEAGRPPPHSAVDSLVSAGEAVYLAGEIDSARLLWQRAMELSRTGDDSTIEPRALTWLGLAAYRQGDYDEARRLGEQALALKRSRGLDSEIPRSQIALGLLAWNEGRLSEALDHYRAAAEGGRRFGNDSVVGRASVNLGLVHADLGEFEAAGERIREGLAIAERLGDHRLAGGALANLGMLELWAGSPAAAIAWLDSARAQYQRIGYVTGIENVLGQLGAAYSALGEPARALASLDTALAIAREQGLRREEGENLELQAGVLREAGDPARALRLLEEAQAIYAGLELPGERGNALRQAAGIRFELDDLPAALALAGSALTMHLDAQARIDELSDRLLLAELHHRTGSTAVAAAQLDTAARLSREIGTPAARLAAALTRARLELADGRPAAALAALAFDAAEVRRFASGAAWEIHALRARAWAAQGDLDSAAAEGELAIGLVERIRNAHISGALRTAYTARRADAYADLALVRLRQGRLEDAFAVADAARGRALLEHLVGVRGRIDDEAARELREGERLLRRIDALVARLEEAVETGGERGTVPDEMDALERRLERARLEYETRLIKVSSGDPRAVSLMGARRVASHEVRASLLDGEVLVEYLSTPERLVTFLLTRDTLHALEQPVSSASLAAQVRLARDLVARSDLDTAASLAVLESLYERLVAPAERAGLLAGARTLILVPHEALSYLPFAALRSRAGRSYLADEYALWTLPTSSALPAHRAPAAAGLDDEVTLTATVLAPFPERLPASEREARRAAVALETRHVLVGAAATEAALRRALAGATTVHVATHGVLNARNPFFSRIELARGRRRAWSSSDDGRLELHELFGIRIRSSLVVLSGCETGLGRAWSTDFAAGEDYATLAQAMLFAGAGGVIATLWRVGDDGAAALAERFYHHLQSHAPAAALARAQRDLRRDPRWSSPYHWAGYRLNGEGLRQSGAQMARAGPY